MEAVLEKLLELAPNYAIASFAIYVLWRIHTQVVERVIPAIQGLTETMREQTASNNRMAEELRRLVDKAA